MATILPQAETQFTDALGVPLAGGSVYFYTPSTTTPKDTYQDALQTILNPNPIPLDSAGRAIIFGAGAYRQIVTDALGNLIWDQTTSESVVGQTSFGGTSTGSANAQIVSAGTFSGSDGSVINFTAGYTNSGAMTVQVGSAGSPVAVLKNGVSGPVNLAAGDIVAGNVYSISYSVSLGTFQLLQSLPAAIQIASQAEAIAGTNNTNVMTALRTRQSIQALSGVLTASPGDLIYGSGASAWTNLAKGGAGQALRMNSAGTAPSWGSGGAADAVLEDQKTSGTDGGTFSSGAWRTRDLNTEVRDVYSLISIAANQFTPTANGWVMWEAPAYQVNRHKTRLFNVTDSAIAAVGSSAACGSSDFSTTLSTGQGAVLAGKTYRIEHQCATSNSGGGYGLSSGFTSTIEVYTRVSFWRT